MLLAQLDRVNPQRTQLAAAQSASEFPTRTPIRRTAAKRGLMVVAAYRFCSRKIRDLRTTLRLSGAVMNSPIDKIGDGATASFRTVACQDVPKLSTTPSIIAYPRSQLRRSTCWARGISESVALRVLFSNCALSPAPQRACRSGRDSQSFSCGGGTCRTRDDSSSP